MRRGEQLFSDLQGPLEKGLGLFMLKALKEIACSFEEERSQFQLTLLTAHRMVRTDKRMWYQPLILPPGRGFRWRQDCISYMHCTLHPLLLLCLIHAIPQDHLDQSMHRVHLSLTTQQRVG